MDSKVILIDDDKDTNDVFSEYLTSRGFEVLATGTDGKEAAKLYKELNPDVVVLDIMMPEYDGIYGIENIRKISKKAKIIVATADISPATTKKLDELNPTAVLYKPFDLKDLEDLISKTKRIDDAREFQAQMIKKN